MAEKDVVEELLSIHNNAINRMQTYSKYSMDAQQQADLEYKITQASAQMKEQHFEEIVQASLEKSQAASKKRINALFKDFDNSAQEGYEVEGLEDLEAEYQVSYIDSARQKQLRLRCLSSHVRPIVVVSAVKLSEDYE